MEREGRPTNSGGDIGHPGVLPRVPDDRESIFLELYGWGGPWAAGNGGVDLEQGSHGGSSNRRRRGREASEKTHHFYAMLVAR
ncbi:hypothetical protein E2562_022504 [Oryza meyeriana var. granulata]|uniref:Uncharacterized protein n=1 Tax=Oryza meyeriana var. granulata TaxID=110450 RepID=A0A6G1BLN5_9ORYZ|nr:hypothetical protein E2562_022504 [Oryza meyeriana var. granulata]